MKIVKELLPGCFLITPSIFLDQRGTLVKTYQEDLFTDLGLNFTMKEEFYTKSYKHVIRGMHFQIPPHEHEKLVCCMQGVVKDVLLDLRMGSSYGEVASIDLSGVNPQFVFIPKGIAHGFMVLSSEALMLYKTTTPHSPESDSGILWNSFGYDWEVKNPEVSNRDKIHQKFNNFSSPFIKDN